MIFGDKGASRTSDAGIDLYKQRLEKMPQSIFMPKKRSLTSTTDVFSVSPYVSTDRLPYNSIAMIDIIGPVLKYGDYCAYGTVEYNELILRLANSPRVTGIILNIDSPGGQADGTAMFAQTIREVARNSKPVIAIVQDGIAASAAMWIASAAQEIYVTQPTDQVGSIGAYQLLYDYSGYLEEMGVKEHLILAPQSTDKIKDYLDALKGDYTLIKEDLKFLVDDFVKAVKAGRGARLSTGEENVFTGKMYRAAEAKKLGLIDGVKSFAQVIQRMEQLIKLRG
ncbi:MAG TPA: S49 family peptidase [Chitinophagaceae bacterium]|nr:S49 family peptidase [Chitinophagaceae bacterium]